MLFKYRKYFIFVISIFALICLTNLALATDGSGAVSVSPTWAVSGSQNNTHTFTFSATETMDSGGFLINVPSGWTTPQGLAGTAGYTTANSSSGIIGTVLNNLDAATNWNTIPDMTLSVDASDKHEGTGSLSNSIAASASAGEQWYFNYGVAENWGDANAINLRVGFWIKSSVALSAGDLQWQDDDSANLASPLDTINIPAVPANTWTYVSVTLGAATRTSILSYGFKYNVDIGAATIKIDSISPLFDAAEATTAWKSDPNITRSVLTTAGNFKEGTGAIRCAYAGGAGIGNAGQCYSNNGNFVIGPGSTVSFWLRSSVNLNAGDFVWKDDNSGDFTSPADTVNVPALTANTWTYITLSAPNSSNLTQKSYGFEQVIDKGALNLDIDAIGKIIDTADSNTGWSVPVATQTLSADSTVKQEGTNSLKNTLTAGAGAGSKWYQTLGSAQDWSSYTTIGLWIRSTVATLAGDLKFEYSSGADTTNPIASINIGALSANTWTYQQLTLGGTRTSVNSYGINYSTDLGATTINVDDILIGPGLPTFSGNNINVRLLKLSNGQTVNVVYGSGGGTSGVTVPATCSTSTFAIQTKSSDSGTLTAIGSNPTIATVGPTSLLTLNDAADLTVGQRAAYTVTRKDDCGNLVTAGSTTVYLYSTSVGAHKKFYDSAVGGNEIASVVIGSGNSSATFWYYDETPGTYTITTSDNASAPDGVAGLADATDQLIFSADSLAQFTLNDPGNLTAGSRLGYVITRKDQFGNLITSGNTTVYLYTTGTGGNQKFYNDATAGNQIAQIDITNGQSSANVWYYSELIGTDTVTASDNASAPDGVTGVTDASDNVLVSPGNVGQFILNDPGNMTAGTRLGYTVTRKDSFGNLVTAGATTVYLYTTSTGVASFYDNSTAGNIITSINIADGSSSANFWYYDETAGNWDIKASDNASAPDGSAGIIDAQDPIVVDPAPIVATRFVILDPTDGTVDSAITVTVQAQDDSGNLDTTYQTDVTLLASGSATGGGLVSIVNGVGTLNIADTVAQTINLTLSDTQTSGLNITSTQNLVFAPGAVTKFILNNPGDLTAGNRLAYAVSRKDQYNNLVTAGANTVYLYSNSTGASNKFYDQASLGNVITSINITPGNSSANFWYYDDKVGTWTLAVSDNASATDGTTGIDDDTDSLAVTAGPTFQFLLSNPGGMTANTRLGYTVSREDEFGNAVTNGGANIYLYSNSTGAHSFYNVASGGSALTSIPIINSSSTANFWYTDSAAGTWTITASDNAGAPDGATGITDGTDSVAVSPEPIVATRLVILPVATALVGDNVTVTVQAQDDSGNVDTTYQQDVTLITDGSATGAGLINIANGSGTKIIADAVAETVNLSLDDTQSTGLNISSTQTLTFVARGVGGAITTGSGEIPVIIPEVVVPTNNFVVSGKVYPSAVVLITEKNDTGGQSVVQTAIAGGNGSFKTTVNNEVDGLHIYGITVKDRTGRVSQTKIFNTDFTKINDIAKTIFMAPTLDVTRSVITKGDFVKVIGYANSNTRLRIQIDNNISYETKSDAQGAYSILINTASLSLDTHSLQARQQDPATGKYSDPSLLRNFVVTSLPVPKADLNGDGQINAQDLSIFTSLYKQQDKGADLNGDGQVTATDLSIFLKAIK